MQIDKLILQKHAFIPLLKSKLWGKNVETSHRDLCPLWQNRPPNVREPIHPLFRQTEASSRRCFSHFYEKIANFVLEIWFVRFFFYFRHFQSSWIFDFYIWVLLVEKSTSFFCFFTLNGTFFTGAFSSFSQPQTFFKKTVPEFQKG